MHGLSNLWVRKDGALREVLIMILSFHWNYFVKEGKWSEVAYVKSSLPWETILSYAQSISIIQKKMRWLSPADLMFPPLPSLMLLAFALSFSLSDRERIKQDLGKLSDDPDEYVGVFRALAQSFYLAWKDVVTFKADPDPWWKAGCNSLWGQAIPSPFKKARGIRARRTAVHRSLGSPSMGSPVGPQYCSGGLEQETFPSLCSWEPEKN